MGSPVSPYAAQRRRTLREFVINTTLLAVHVTAALALTILLGVQCSELSRLRHQPTGGGTRPRGLTAILLAIPAATLAVAASGGLVLRSGSHTGPWVGGGVFAAVVILTTSIWALRILRTPNGRSAPHRKAPAAPSPAQVTAIAVAQWGAPAFALAGTYLMAARPEEAAGAILPVVLALVITAAATGHARRTSPTRI